MLKKKYLLASGSAEVRVKTGNILVIFFTISFLGENSLHQKSQFPVR
jgi:hypothetical protein